MCSMAGLGCLIFLRLRVCSIANSMRNGAEVAAPENAKQAFSGAFAATGCTDFELIRFNFIVRNCILAIEKHLLVNPRGALFRFGAI